MRTATSSWCAMPMISWWASSITVTRRDSRPNSKTKCGSSAWNCTPRKRVFSSSGGSRPSTERRAVSGSRRRSPSSGSHISLVEPAEGGSRSYGEPPRNGFVRSCTRSRPICGGECTGRFRRRAHGSAASYKGTSTTMRCPITSMR